MGVPIVWTKILPYTDLCIIDIVSIHVCILELGALKVYLKIKSCGHQDEI